MKTRVLVLLSVASIIAIVTIVIGLALTGQPNWHFTILDVVTDIGGGVVFGLLAQALVTYLGPSRTRLRWTVAVLSVVGGVLSVLTIEGGAAAALIFGL